MWSNLWLNKFQVSIIQIASEKRAFIFDLIKLYEEEPLMLNSCFRRILCSSHILKLGNFFLEFCLFGTYCI